MVSQDSRKHCRVQLNEQLWFYGVLIVFQPRKGMKPAPLIYAWNPPMKILVSAFEIWSGLFYKQQL